MPLEYQHNQKIWETLLPVIEEQGQWFHNLLEYLFYPVSEGAMEDVRKLASFDEWVVSANESENVRPEIVEKLNALHNDLFKNAELLMSAAKEGGKKPPHKDFKDLITMYEEYISYIRRLEKDFMIEGAGFDSFTGLRSVAVLCNDVEREMERLARQGKSFCLSVARIDHFEGLSKNNSKEDIDNLIKLVASLIKISIRSFDDAYYIGNGEFALCLKQADISGGVAALERLRNELDKKNIALDSIFDEKKVSSMSCCIAEPIEGDKVEELVTHLREDLAGSDMENEDTVLKHRELSPLQRYVEHKD